MKLQTLNLVILIVGFVTSVSAQVDLPLGTRPQGLGGAFVAIANDANAVYWNPSGLSQIRKGEVTLMHWAFADLRQIMINYGSFVYPFSQGAFGFSWTRYAADLEEGPYNSKSTMTQNALTLSYGLKLIPSLSAGISINRTIIDTKIENGAGWGFDFGLLATPLDSREWAVGAAAKNVAANMKNENLTPWYILGTAYTVNFSDTMHTITTAFDVNTREDVEGKEGITLKYAGGLEYRLSSSGYAFAIRGGLGSKNYSFGFSVGYRFVSVDYAFVKMREETIGNSQKIGVNLYFKE